MTTRPMKIAVGIDHSDESVAAAEWAAAAAVDHDWSLLLVHGYAPPMLVQSLPGYRLDLAHDLAQNYVDSVADRLRSTYPTPVITTAVSHEPVVPLLTGVSAQVDALVLGHHRLGWAERLMGGSISCALSGLSQCPVVTVPYGMTRSDDGPIVLAVDVDAPSDRAMEVAFDRAELVGGHVAVVCAIRDDLTPAEIEATYRRADQLLDPCRRNYPTCTVSLQLIPGAPHRALATAVPQASLQVVTRPRVRTSPTLWVRSVARAMQRHSDCPIAVVEHSV